MVLLLAGVLTSVAAVGADAWAPAQLVERRPAAQAAPGVSLDRAVALAEQRYRARVVRAGVSDAEGRRVYVLKLLSDQGRVWTVRVDAETGAMN
jgi:uncharacterized membrane protein YkoI